MQPINASINALQLLYMHMCDIHFPFALEFAARPASTFKRINYLIIYKHKPSAIS